MKMKRIVSIMIILAFFVSFTSLVQAKKKWKISISLEKVVIESGSEKKSPEANPGNNRFADDYIETQWSPEPKAFNFELQNNGNSPMVIIWEKSSFIDEKGKIHKIIHSRVKLTQSPKPIPPTSIPIKEKITDMVYPRDYASLQPKLEVVQDFSTGATTTYEKMEWEKMDIYPKKMTLKEMKKKDKDFDIATYFENTRFTFILALKIGEKIYNYHFIFKPIGK